MVRRTRYAAVRRPRFSGHGGPCIQPLEARRFLYAPPAVVDPDDAGWMWVDAAGEGYRIDIIAQPIEYALYAFMPSWDGAYQFYSSAEFDAVLRLYDAAGNALTDPIDQRSGGFETWTADLVAGNWVHVAISGYGDADIGEYVLFVNGPDAPAAPLATPGPSFQGAVDDAIEYGGGMEFHALTAPAGATSLSLVVTPDGAFDVYVEVYDDARAFVDYADMGYAGEAEMLTMPVEAGRTYLVGISGFNRTTFGTYRLEADFDPDAATPHAGDTNGDARVDAADYHAADRGFALGLSGWENGDFDGVDGVTPDDYLVLDSAFMAALAAQTAGGGSGGAPASTGAPASPFSPFTTKPPKGESLFATEPILA